MTYPNSLFSAFAFIGFLMCAIPLPWHLQARNATGTCLYMIWTGLGCLNLFINSVIWTGNTINRAPIWCDISTKFIIGVSTAIPAASLCINRRLYHISCVRVVTATKTDKRRAIMVDLAIGLGLPVLAMALHYIIQGHRFDIFEDIGCSPASDYVWPIYPILLLPPIFIGVFSATYSTLTIIAFYKRRSQISALLSSNNFSPNRFIRLMCVAGAEILFTIPLSLYGISIEARNPLYPWVSWEHVHSQFSNVEQFPNAIWRSDRMNEISLELPRWATVFCAFVFFSLIGLSDEARSNYRHAFQSVAKSLGISTGLSGSDLNSSGFKRNNGMKPEVIESGLNRSNVIGTDEMEPKASGKVLPVVSLSVHEDIVFQEDDTIYLSFPSLSSSNI